MEQLAYNRRIGDMTVTPKNWKTGPAKLLKQRWIVRYRYYDDNEPKVNKQILLSNCNRETTLEGRRRELQQMMADELYLLRTAHIDPRYPERGSIIPPEEKPTTGKFMSFESALRFADSKIKVSEDTRKKETNYILRHLITNSQELSLSGNPICEITRKHLRDILDRASITENGVSQNKFNRCRKVLSMYYKELLDFEIVDSNIPHSLNKQKESVKKLNPEISPEGQKRLSDYLKENFRPYWLYLQVFYNSAPRSTEMMQIKVKDVDLVNQRIKFTVKKGVQYTEKYRVIPDLALAFWKEIIGDAPKDWFVFAKGLQPGPVSIKSYQIHKRWYRLITKNPDFADIEITFYRLKHLRLTDMADSYGLEQAASLAAENKDTVTKHYDLNSKRGDDRLKKSGKEF